MLWGIMLVFATIL